MASHTMRRRRDSGLPDFITGVVRVTVGPWDLPPAWFDQLAPGGRLVVPLHRLVVPLHRRGQARSVAFVHEDGVVRAIDSRLCGFIPMIGDGRDGE